MFTKEVAELRHKVSELEKTKNNYKKELNKAKEECKQSTSEMERLLQIMSSTEDEKFSLNQQIKELQDSLRDREAKLNSMKRSIQAEKGKGVPVTEDHRRRDTDQNKDASKGQKPQRSRVGGKRLLVSLERSREVHFKVT
ncbi:uncharacterized protein LOC111083975 [Limulus polyphemus]|uniref:Uncharacterized protein LOC111083975 n=1 Tax=Limulus polyphemus TaxID=6850 RepID=A0ABM1RYI4_LIMPO|nr:uncharacterized protein LOC111083975 [Limulus polyphemus]